MFGTKLTLGILKNKLEEHGILKSTKLNVISPGATFSLGEFKADILIKLKEYEEAIFCLEQSNKKFNYILAQVLRMTQENLNLEDFKEALFDIFEEENIKRALEIIDEKSSLINLEFANEYKNILNLFDSKNKKYI